MAALGLPGPPRPVWTLFAGTMVNRLGYVVTPFLVFYLGSRGVSTRDIPWVLGALGVGNLLGPALGGLLADGIGRRTTMLVGLLGTAAAQGALYLAPGPVTMSGAALLLSTSGATVSPAAYALMADSVEADRRQAAYGLFGWGINLGTAVAGVLGGFLAAHGYWLLFAVDAGTALGYAAVVLALLPRDRQSAARPGGATSDADGVGYGVVLRDRLLLSLLGLFGVSLFVYSLTESVLPSRSATRAVPGGLRRDGGGERGGRGGPAADGDGPAGTVPATAGPGRGERADRLRRGAHRCRP
ncbi:MFS transporter [Streptacidiphilus monticola]